MHDSYPKDCRRVVLDSASSVTRLTQDINWVYVRRSEEIQDVLWRSHVRSVYVLCPRGSESLLLHQLLLFTKFVLLRGKCPNMEWFLVRIFPHSDWIQRDASYLSVFIPNVGKCGPDVTPYLDIFHAVIASNTRPWNKDLLRKYHL